MSYRYADITLGFVDPDGTVFEKFFPCTATDFEIDHFLTQLLPHASYRAFDFGQPLYGIGNRAITYRDKHTSIGDFFPDSEEIKVWLSTDGTTRTQERFKTLCVM